VGGIVRSLAVELGPLGIRANAILAGAIRTDRWSGLSDEEVARRRARWPIGRETTPEQIADAVAFLCSDAASTITGAEIPVDSGIGVCLLANNPRWMENDPANDKYWEKRK
jgi:NAD(P)-dependent dehydrogenase (short-subunit alcohol dehydrogenase family)